MKRDYRKQKMTKLTRRKKNSRMQRTKRIKKKSKGRHLLTEKKIYHLRKKKTPLIMRSSTKPKTLRRLSRSRTMTFSLIQYKLSKKYSKTLNSKIPKIYLIFWTGLLKNKLMKQIYRRKRSMERLTISRVSKKTKKKTRLDKYCKAKDNSLMKKN